MVLKINYEQIQRTAIGHKTTQTLLQRAPHYSNYEFHWDTTARKVQRTKQIVSKSELKNLKRYFSKAQINSENRNCSVTKCAEIYRDVLITRKSITLKSEKTWKVSSTMNCKARCVIYVIICSKCDSFYVRLKIYEKEWHHNMDIKSLQTSKCKRALKSGCL